MLYFVRRPRRTFTRDDLLQQVWKSSAAWQQPSTVTEHVRRLRNKLGQQDGSMIVSVRGIGYRLDAAEALSNAHATEVLEPA